MADELLELPESGGFMDNLAGMFNFFIDPQAAARYVFRKWFWVAPFLVTSIVVLVVAVLSFPFAQQAMLNMPPPPNVAPEQFQKQMQVGIAIQRVAVWFTPVIVAIIIAVSSLIIYASAAVMGIKARFSSLFNLLYGCSLISALQAIATFIIIKAKGEVSTMADLQPPLGLDIFLPAVSSKMLVAFFDYFNIFELWYVVMAILIFAVAYTVSKGKAFLTLLPFSILGLVLKLAGAMFQR